MDSTSSVAGLQSVAPPSTVINIRDGATEKSFSRKACDAISLYSIYTARLSVGIPMLVPAGIALSFQCYKPLACMAAACCFSVKYSDMNVWVRTVAQVGGGLTGVGIDLTGARLFIEYNDASAYAALTTISNLILKQNANTTLAEEQFSPGDERYFVTTPTVLNYLANTCLVGGGICCVASLLLCNSYTASANSTATPPPPTTTSSTDTAVPFSDTDIADIATDIATAVPFSDTDIATSVPVVQGVAIPPPMVEVVAIPRGDVGDVVTPSGIARLVSHLTLSLGSNGLS